LSLASDEKYYVPNHPNGWRSTRQGGSAFIRLKRLYLSTLTINSIVREEPSIALVEGVKRFFLEVEEMGLKILRLWGWRDFFSSYGYCSDREPRDPNEVMGQLKVKQAKEDNRDWHDR